MSGQSFTLHKQLGLTLSPGKSDELLFWLRLKSLLAYNPRIENLVSIESELMSGDWLKRSAVAASLFDGRKLMAYLKPQRPEKVTAPSLRASKERGERLVCLTAYDYTMARIVDEAGIDIILVGDSIGNTMLGYGNTVPVTLDEIVMHTRAVRRGVQRALLVSDMPYGSFHTGEDEAVRNALRLIKEGAAEAVKLEGGQKRAPLVKRLVDEEIPVMGHIGLTPQSVNKLGGYRVQGKTAETARQLLADAQALEEAGAFSIVLEVVPREIAQMITESVKIPTIGIGAGLHCDIQVLVIHDLLGLTFGKVARFVRPYTNLRETITDAISHWAEDVRNGSYPAEAESYGLPAEAADELKITKSETDVKVKKQ